MIAADMALEAQGLIVPFLNQHVLVMGPEADAFGVPLFGPPVYLRPGYRFYARPDYLLPSAVVDDYGQRFEAPACYEWLEARGDAFPRSDVLGVLPGGQPISAVVKELDLIELAVFASSPAQPDQFEPVDLAILADAPPAPYALAPAAFPFAVLERGLPCYQLAPGLFGAVAAAIVSQLLHTRRHDWRLTFDDVDEAAGL